MENRILIVDDAMFMRMMIRDILIAAGYDVVGEASDGAEAVEMFSRLRPDLVLMDITMPEVNGIKAVQDIKGIDPDAKIVMVSAMGQQSMVIKSIKSGAIDFVVKPFKPDHVIGTVSKAISSQIAI